MLPLSRRRGVPLPYRVLGLVALLLGLGTGAARADFVISGTYSPISSGFLYQLSITNNGADDLLLVSLFKTGLLTDVTPIGAPAGFTVGSSSDGTTTFVDFAPSLGSSATFAPGTTVGSFNFSATEFLLDAPEFFGLDVNGGDAQVGTLGEVAQVAAPEPGALALAVPGLLVLGGHRLRRRRLIRSDI